MYIAMDNQDVRLIEDFLLSEGMTHFEKSDFYIPASNNHPKLKFYKHTGRFDAHILEAEFIESNPNKPKAKGTQVYLYIHVDNNRRRLLAHYSVFEGRLINLYKV